MSKDERQIEWTRHRLHKQIVELAESIKKDRPIPDFLIAMCVGGLVSRLFVLCPKHMTEALIDPLVETHRTRNGLCVDCDNPVEIVKTHPLKCDTCEAIEEAVAAEIEEELAETDDEECDS